MRASEDSNLSHESKRGQQSAQKSKRKHSNPHKKVSVSADSNLHLTKWAASCKPAPFPHESEKAKWTAICT
jgi:hypothetical protein